MTGCVVKYLHIQNRRYAANRAGCLTAMDHNGMYTRNKKDGTKLNEIRHSVKWVGFWIGMAAICCGIIWAMLGSKSGLEFAAGYLIELSLSVDNLFVFMSIFLSFGIREKVQHRVLNWGIIGAIVLRFLFIFYGLKIVNSFSWILYIFGAILIINGIKMMIGKEEEKDPSDSRIIKGVSRVLPMTDHFEGDRFMVKKNGCHLFTPLFAVLCLVECSDIIFAIDSVPAVFSVSTNLLIVYSSNIFAILGLRQMYFVLEHLQERFRYVKYGVGIILMFTGVKLGALILDFHISTTVSICVIFFVIVFSVIMSVIISGKDGKR